MVRKQTKEENEITGACIDEERKLEANLLLKRSQEFKKIPKGPTIQLQSLRVRLAVIAYRKWDFKILVLGKQSFNLENIIVATYVQRPKELENGNGVWITFEPIDNLVKREENR